MSFPTRIHTSASAGEHFANRASKNFPLGQIMELEDGRLFRHALCGGTSLVTGDLIQSKVHVVGDCDLVVQANGSVGDTTISVTATQTTAANFYTDGWLVVSLAGSSAAALNQIYRVKSHPIFAAGTKVITLGDNESLRVAITTSDEVSLIPNAYDAVIQAVITTLTAPIAGVCQSALTATYYGWLQTRGVCGIKSDTSLILGQPADAILAAAGRCGVRADTPPLDQDLGIVLSISTTGGDISLINLTID